MAKIVGEHAPSLQNEGISPVHLVRSVLTGSEPMLYQSTRRVGEKTQETKDLLVETSVPEKNMEKVILGATEICLKNKAIIRRSQHVFIRGKSSLSNLISFYDKDTHLVDERKAADIFLDFSKAFNTAPQSTLLGQVVQL